LIKLLFLLNVYANQLNYSCTYNNKNVNLLGNTHHVRDNIIYTYNPSQEWVTLNDGKHTVTYHLKCSVSVIIDKGTERETK
jgi:hypothetical protein